MEINDTLSYYFHKMQSDISATNEAHLRCSTDLTSLPDNSSQQAIKFIKCLSPKYEYFKSPFEHPVTIEDAFTVTSTCNEMLIIMMLKEAITSPGMTCSQLIEEEDVVEAEVVIEVVIEVIITIRNMNSSQYVIIAEERVTSQMTVDIQL